MRELVDLVQRGGPVMVAILALSVVLYSRCFKLLLALRRSRRELDAARGSPISELRRLREEVHESFRQQRLALGAMITAAPLLGLLGTVSGMVTTFESLSGHTQEKIMGGLAKGISEVLVATESGLVVAIPALMVVHLANRSLRKYMQRVSEIEQSAWGGAHA
ncbi:MAG TPA: MotA/TolQ/ExbB proton channel family protein [Opitutaceae bacterium]|jgi:biopolymer transport protein ExbB/TolQ|nr:MotA/TolQ/ExbB proton channel family protein [Opitutaceae bacterium]